jgi:hypothetical protein
MNQVPPSDLSARLLAGAKTSAHVSDTNVHTHAHGGVRPNAKFSLLRLSALERLGGVAVLLIGLWALVFWALR